MVETSYLIDKAEIEIIKLSKQAVLYLWSLNRYKTEVDKVIKEVEKTANIPVRLGLERYASNAYSLQHEIQKKNILLLSVALISYEKKERGAKAVLSDVQKSVGDIAETPAFKKTSPFYETAVSINDNYFNQYYKEVKEETARLIEMNAKEDYTTNVSLRNIAEMTVRYEHQKKMISDLIAKGVDLVWIIPHSNCSSRCEPYQGRLYSLSGRSGTVDGIKYLPLTYATDNPKDQYITKAGKVYQNGCITGFNCRHKLEEYRKGSIVKPIPAKAVEKAKAIEERQRAYEREVRKLKKAAEEYGKTKVGMQMKSKAKKVEEAYIAFSRKNKVAYYPQRLK